MRKLKKNAGILSAAGKALPLIGGAVSLYDMGKDIGRGDTTGLGIDAVSAGLSLAGGINPFFSVPATVALDLYNQQRKEKFDRRRALKSIADRHQLAARIMSQNEKQAASNFSRDLENPRAGLDSDLYQAIAPIIGRNIPEGISPEELAKEQLLREQVRKGLVGLEYMTGLKKNTGNTYYDEHPISAVTTDLLGNSGKLGLGIAALGTGKNLYNQYKNFKMTRPSEEARKGNYGVDPSHPRNLLNPKEGPVRSDIARVFGDFNTDPETRLRLIDELNTSGGRATNFTDEYNKLISTGKDPKKLFAEANKSSGAAMLEEYANFHESTQRAKASGGFKKYFGEDSHIAPGAGTASEGAINKLIRTNLAPEHMQGFTDLAEASNLTKSNPQYHRGILTGIAEEYSPGAGAKAFSDTGLKYLENTKLRNSGFRRLFNRAKLPIAAGAAAALGGTGLYALVKAIQNQTHSKEKMRDWKKTLLQARGDFDRAQLYEPQGFEGKSDRLKTSRESLEQALPPTTLTQEEVKEDKKAPEYLAPSAPSHRSQDEMDWSEALNSVR
jgi:hypothetical protein